MTKAEIYERFEAGEEIVRKGVYYAVFFIGKDKISQNQFIELLEDFKERYTVEKVFSGGFNKHIYKFKK